MSPPFGLVASDLDGTLLGPDGVVSARATAVLRRLARQGVAVTAATGRSHRTALPLLAPVGVVSWAVCSNGALVLDTRTGTALATRTMPADTVAAAVDAAREAVPGVAVAWETAAGFGAEAAFLALRPGRQAWAADRIGLPGPGDDVLKLMVDHPELTHDDLRRALAATLPGGLTAAASSAPFVEVTGAGVDKASGLSVLCEHLQLDPSGVIAFGDHDNDAAMLRWAGRGVAMAHAHPTALAAADEVAPPGVDGVADVLEVLLGA